MSSSSSSSSWWSSSAWLCAFLTRLPLMAYLRKPFEPDLITIMASSRRIVITVKDTHLKTITTDGATINNVVLRAVELRVGLLASALDNDDDDDDDDDDLTRASHKNNNAIHTSPWLVVNVTGVRVDATASVDELAAARQHQQPNAPTATPTKRRTTTTPNSTFTSVLRLLTHILRAVLTFARDAALRQFRVTLKDVSVRLQLRGGQTPQRNVEASLEMSLDALAVGGGAKRGSVAASVERVGMALDLPSTPSVASFALPQLTVAAARLGPSAEVSVNLPLGVDVRIGVHGATTFAAFADAAVRATARARYGVPTDVTSKWRAAFCIARDKWRAVRAAASDEIVVVDDEEVYAAEAKRAEAQGRAAVEALEGLASRLRSALLLRGGGTSVKREHDHDGGADENDDLSTAAVDAAGGATACMAVHVHVSRASVVVGTMALVVQDARITARENETQGIAQGVQCELAGVPMAHALLKLEPLATTARAAALKWNTGPNGVAVCAGTLNLIDPFALADAMPSVGACVSALMSSDWHNVQRSMGLENLPSKVARLRARATYFATEFPSVASVDIRVAGLQVNLAARTVAGEASASLHLGATRVRMSPPASSRSDAASLASGDYGDMPTVFKSMEQPDQALMARLRVEIASIDAALDGVAASARIAAPCGVALDAFIAVIAFDMRPPDFSVRVVGGTSIHADVGPKGSVQRLADAAAALADLSRAPRLGVAKVPTVAFADPPTQVPLGTLSWRIDATPTTSWALRATMRLANVGTAAVKVLPAHGTAENVRLSGAWLGVAAHDETASASPALAIGIMRSTASWIGKRTVINVSRVLVRSAAVAPPFSGISASEALPLLLQHWQNAPPGGEALVLTSISITMEQHASYNKPPAVHVNVGAVRALFEATGAWSCARLVDVATRAFGDHGAPSRETSKERSRASNAPSWSVCIGPASLSLATAAPTVRPGVVTYAPSERAVVCAELAIAAVEVNGASGDTNAKVRGISACHYNARARAWEPILAPFNMTVDSLHDNDTLEVIVNPIEISSNPAAAATAVLLAANRSVRWEHLDSGGKGTSTAGGGGMGKADAVDGVGVAIAAPYGASTALRRSGSGRVFVHAHARERAGYFDTSTPMTSEAAPSPAPLHVSSYSSISSAMRNLSCTSFTTAVDYDTETDDDDDDDDEGATIADVQRSIIAQHHMFVVDHVPSALALSPELPPIATPPRLLHTVAEEVQTPASDTNETDTFSNDGDMQKQRQPLLSPSMHGSTVVFTRRVASASNLVLATEAAATAARALSFGAAAAVVSAVTPPPPPLRKHRLRSRERRIFLRAEHIGLSVLDGMGTEMLYARVGSIDVQASPSKVGNTGKFHVEVASVAIDDTRHGGHVAVIRWGSDEIGVADAGTAAHRDGAAASGTHPAPSESLTRRLSVALEQWVSPRVAAVHVEASWRPSTPPQNAAEASPASVRASISAAHLDLMLDMRLATALASSYAPALKQLPSSHPTPPRAATLDNPAEADPTPHASTLQAFVWHELSIAPLSATISVRVRDHGTAPLRGTGLAPSVVALFVALAALERFEMVFARTVFRAEDADSSLLSLAALHYGKKLAATVPRALANAAAFGRVEATLRELGRAASGVIRAPLDAYRASLAVPHDVRKGATRLQRHARAVTAAAAGVARGAGVFAQGASSACLVSAAVATEAWRLAAAELAAVLPAAAYATTALSLWGLVLERLGARKRAVGADQRDAPIRPPRLPPPRPDAATGSNAPSAACAYDALGAAAADAVRRCPGAPKGATPDAVSGAADLADGGIAVLAADALLVCARDAHGRPNLQSSSWRPLKDAICVRRHGGTVRAVFLESKASRGLKALCAVRMPCAGGSRAATWLEEVLGRGA
ncbi:hypothetical protein NFJ02_23g53260 [Pycnococcus provasolii]